MTGELEFDNSFSETVVTLEGSVQLIFIGFFVTANIVIINVLISIAITVLKDGRVIKEELAAMARTLAVLELEQGIKWVRVSSSSYVICVNEMLFFQLMKRYRMRGGQLGISWGSVFGTCLCFIFTCLVEFFPQVKSIGKSRIVYEVC